MIICKTPRELEIMREAGRIVALTHEELKKHIKPGISTKELDQIAERFITKQGAIPSFKVYNGFRGSICVSVNEELVHGIPGKRVLRDGDIISIDIGAKLNGYHGDSAWTYPVGVISDEDRKLLEVTEESLYKGLQEAKPGERLSNISHAIQTYVEDENFSVVREYVGHGVGQDLHEDPQIPHYGPPNKGPRLKPGMVLAIEPMVNAGSRYVKTLADNWTVVSVGGKLCAQVGQASGSRDTGFDILTKI
ncbi:type I methionyl aminopeptidase [Bacillus altitudinis]|uniref:type I methionyl aminopeptidase n=1 Tax=Bacillus altitudinis TaxID=293387 RepID=UPI003653B8FE